MNATGDDRVTGESTGIWNLNALRAPAAPGSAADPLPPEGAVEARFADLPPLSGGPLPSDDGWPASPPLFPDQSPPAFPDQPTPLFPDQPPSVFADQSPPLPDQLPDSGPGPLPPWATRTGRPALYLAMVLGLAAAMVAGYLIVKPSGDDPGAAPPVPTYTRALPTEPIVPTTGAVTTRAAEPTTSPTDPQVAALAELERLRLQDAQAAQPDGSWVAQLSSKAEGIVDPRLTAANGTHTFLAADILAEHRQLRSAGLPGVQVILVLSTDIGKRQLYEGRPLWLTFGLGAFGDARAVTVWCAQRYPGLGGADLDNRCVARRFEAPRG